MANGIFSKLYEMETGEQGPLSLAGRIQAVEGLEEMQPAQPPPSTFTTGPLGPMAPGPRALPNAGMAPGDPSMVQPYSPHWSTLVGQGLAGVGSAISSGYAAGRGDLQSARQFQQLGENRIQQIGQQARQQAMNAQLANVLPDGIRNSRDMRAAVQIAMQYGMPADQAMGYMMQAYQQRAQMDLAERGIQVEEGILGVKQIQAAADATEPDLDTAKFLTAQYDKTGKAFETIATAADRINAAYEDYKSTGNPQAYQTMGVSLQKLLDPTSVVRESEFARTQAFQSWVDRLNTYKELAKTGAVGPELMKDIYDQAQVVVQAAAKAQKKRYGHLATQAEKAGVTDIIMGGYRNPDDFIGGMSPERPASPTFSREEIADRMRARLGREPEADEIEAVYLELGGV